MIMPLYSYIPFLDPDINGKEKRSYSGYNIYTDDELDPLLMETENPKSPQRTTVDSFKQKVNENLININNKMTDLLQDGLGGVDNICKRVKEVINDSKPVYMENCARGDIYNNHEERRYNTPDPSQESILFVNREQEEKNQEIYNNDNTVFAMQKKAVSKDDNLPTSSKRDRTRSRPTSKSLNCGKSDPIKNTHRLNSKSFDVKSVKSFLNKKSSEKIKSSKTKPKKKTAEAETKPVGETAKKRLGQIERDYRKVVENLGKVERMMACVNERIMHQKNQTSMETVKGKGLKHTLKENNLHPKLISSKSHNFTERNIEHTKSRKKTSIPTDLKLNNNDTKVESAIEDIPQKEVVEETKRTRGIKEDKRIEEKKVGKGPKEVVRQKRKETKEVKQSGDYIKEKSPMETEEERIAEEILNQMKSIEKINNPTLTNSEKESRKKFEQLGALNPLSKIKINDSLTDIDAMIENAVMELGNLVSPYFNISRSSSDVSFKLTTEDGAQTLNDERHLLTSSSTSSGSTNAVLGEESEKFEISQSFQELKESYVQKIRQKATDMKKEDAKLLKECDAKTYPELRMKDSYDQLHEEIFNNSSWNMVDPISFEWKFSKNPTRISNSSIDLREDQREDPSDNDSLNAGPGTTIIENVNKQHQTEEIITISLPSVKQHISNVDKSGDVKPKIENIGTKQLEEEGEYAYVHKIKRINEQAMSGSELFRFPDDLEADPRRESTLRKQQKKNVKDKNATRTSTREKAKTPRSARKEEYHQLGEEADNVIVKDVAKKEGAKTKLLKENFKTNPKNEIEEIKKMEIDYSESSSYSSFVSFEEGSTIWADKIQNKEEVKPIDPMKQVSILCKKLIGDLVVEEDHISLEEILDGYFNTPLIQSLVSRPRPRSVRIITPIQDPDLRSIVPEVHRKKALPDLHERMEYQIKQTDSFDGFLNLMNKNRRKAIIKQAERQDHTVRCQMKTCFRKRYPFRVVTASVPAGYDHKFKEKKEPERQYINSLWFSPKDFKLRRNSRIFNRKRMEMYCQSLNKTPIPPMSRYGEPASRENKKIEKASNYSILVRSGTPLGRRPNTPRRWIRPSTPAGGNSQRLRLHHCDILDDLTLKDLTPFNAEYPRNEVRHLPESLEGSFLYKLACGGQQGDADGTLMDLVTPKLSCTQEDCKTCKCKSKLEKRPSRKIRSPRKSGDESSVTSTKTGNLTPKTATQLLIQNIGEIKSKKSSTKSQGSEKNLNKKEPKNHRRSKSLRKNSRKILAQDSKFAIQQRLEENMVKKIFQSHHVAITDFDPKSTPAQRTMAFKGIDHFQKILKVPELYSRPSTRKSNVTKLFPYINDPDNKVFQNITVLPVKVFYNFEPMKDSSGYLEVPEREQPSGRDNARINFTSLSETEELEVSTIECRRPSTADDKNMRKKTVGRRRMGTPKSPAVGSRQNPNKFSNLPPNRTEPPPPMTYPIEITLNRKSKEIIGSNQGTLKSPKISPRRQIFRRSSSLSKSSESDNPVSQLTIKRPANPNPWKPASRRPRTPKTPPSLKPPMRIRSTEKSNFQPVQPCKTISTGWISPKHNTRLQHKAYDKCLADSPRPVQEAKGQHQMQTLVNKERKIRFELNPTDIDLKDTKSNTTRASIHRCRPLSPSQRVMVEHLHMLRNRNSRLQGNIQKAINIIEEKMVDVLSTNDQSYKKKTIDRMEKEINKVLRMINEQNCIMNKKKEDNSETIRKDFQQTTSKTDSIKCVPVVSKQTSDDDSQTHTKALITHTLGLKMPRPPRRRSISRILKLHCRPSTVEEEKSFDLAEESELSRINKETSSQEAICKTKDEKVEEEKEEEKTSKREELYPSSIINEDVKTQLCPVLRCPTPKASVTKLSRKTKHILKKMSGEAFGKFADVVRTKTRLIIDMTERIEMDDTNLLPNPRVTSALPAILARSTNLPVITTIHQPRPSDLMSTTVSSIVTVHQTPIESFLNGSTAPLSGATSEISEFANMCTERSVTSFRESESYTLRKIEQSQPLGLECSTCSLKRKISHDLTPFMRALNNLKAGRLFEKRHQLLPIEETSPTFRKMMSFLEGLSKVKETFNQTTSRDVQLLWNPEKRCSSFHNSLTTKKFRFRKNIKSISEHSMVQCPVTSISELFSTIKIEENPSKTIGDTKKDPEIQTDEEKQNQKTIMEKTDDTKNEITDSNPSELQQEQKRDCKLVISQVQLISIANTKNLTKKHKKRPPISLLYNEPNLMLKDDRYSNFLKFFYFIFYTLVYFCMTTMNFSC